MIRRGTDYHNIYNYRNSKYFIQTVKEARRYDQEKQGNLVIFARSLSKLFWSHHLCWCKLCIIPCKNFNWLFRSTSYCRKNSLYRKIQIHHNWRYSKRTKRWQKWSKWNWCQWENCIRVIILKMILGTEEKIISVPKIITSNNK